MTVWGICEWGWGLIVVKILWGDFGGHSSLAFTSSLVVILRVQRPATSKIRCGGADCEPDGLPLPGHDKSIFTPLGFVIQRVHSLLANLDRH
jgi:hypothetical protein